MTENPRPLTLIIMDGFGLNPDLEGNAVAAAAKPNYDKLISRYPYTQLGSSGQDVGLPAGQMGNSEVGHLNLGAGRVVFQEVSRIDRAIADGGFFRNETLLRRIEETRDNSGRLHLMGLASDGLVHSSLEHLYALLKICRRMNMEKVVIHAFLDGRDTSPTSGAGYLRAIEKSCREIGTGRIGTVIGRYYAMDRDKRWERVKKAYDLIVFGEGLESSDPAGAVEEYYRRGITDEFMEPISVTGVEHELGPADSVIFFNFRADRARQISYSFTDESFTYFERNGGPVVPLVSMTQYDINLKADVAFKPAVHRRILADLLSENGLQQLRTSETEKYPHVTFFFNGGVELSYEGEDRIMIPSPKVATYDLKPEMSAYEVTDLVVGKINDGKYDVIVMNYANCDMVGHTGVFQAAKKAVETVDGCMGRVVDAVLNAGGVAMVTADHGNSEKMMDGRGGPHTAHTTFPVPFILADSNFKGKLRPGGILADVAPTMLDYLNIARPEEMTGKSLIAGN